MEFYSTEEVARMLKVGVVQVQRWLVAGKLRGTKVGKRWLISPQDLEEFVHGKTKEGGKSNA